MSYYFAQATEHIHFLKFLRIKLTVLVVKSNRHSLIFFLFVKSFLHSYVIVVYHEGVNLFLNLCSISRFGEDKKE